jgi:hypothetical protein
VGLTAALTIGIGNAAAAGQCPGLVASPIFAPNCNNLSGGEARAVGGNGGDGGNAHAKGGNGGGILSLLG